MKMVPHDINSYPYTAVEIERLKSGGCFVPELVINLEVGMKQDVRRLLSVLADDAKASADLSWIRPEDGDRWVILARAFEMTIQDARYDMPDEYPPTFYHGRDMIWKIAESSLGIDIAEARSSADLAGMKAEIYTCYLSLAVLGAIDASASLCRLAGALTCFVNSAEGEGLAVGRSKQHGDNLNQIKVLKALRSFLSKSKVPSFKALRQAAFAEFLPNKSATLKEMSPAQFSRLINGMEIRPFLLEDRSCEKSAEGKAYKFTALSFEPAGRLEEGATDSYWNKLLPQTCPPPDSQQGLQGRVAALKSSLGPIFWLVLDCGDMDDITNWQDYERFGSILGELGLAFRSA